MIHWSFTALTLAKKAPKKLMSIISKMFADKPELEKKFKKLEIYFDSSLDENDLVSQDLDKFVSWAEPGLKGLMDIFVQNYLTPYLESINEPRMQTELKFDESD